MPMFQFIGALIGSVVIASVASIAWPKISTSPRPEVLTRVYDTAILTDVGQNFEQVLGASDSGVASIGATIKNSVQQAIILKLFEQLPLEQQEAFRQGVCTPATVD